MVDVDATGRGGEGRAYKVMGVLQIAPDSHLAAAVAVVYGPFAPVVGVGSPGGGVDAVGLRRVVVELVCGGVGIGIEVGVDPGTDIGKAQGGVRGGH